MNVFRIVRFIIQIVIHLFLSTKLIEFEVKTGSLCDDIFARSS